MAELPEPPVPANCDLRDYPWMPLVVPQLKQSKAWSICKRNPALAFYMINLWTASWHNVPAGSLEDDDDVLCDLALCDPKLWPKVREQVMRNWTKHSDDLLYHPTVAKEALASWTIKLAQHARTAAATEARRNKQNGKSKPPGNDDGSANDDVTNKVTSNVTKEVTVNVASDVTTTLPSPPYLTLPNQEKERTSASHSATADAAPPQPPDVRTEFWRDGLGILRRLTGRAEGTSRAFLGRMLKAEALNNDCDAAMAVLHEAESLRPVDPEAWIIAACKARSSRAVAGISARKEAILRAGGMWPPAETTIEHEPQPGRLLQ